MATDSESLVSSVPEQGTEAEKPTEKRISLDRENREQASESPSRNSCDKDERGIGSTRKTCEEEEEGMLEDGALEVLKAAELVLKNGNMSRPGSLVPLKHRHSCDRKHKANPKADPKSNHDTGMRRLKGQG